MRLRRRGFKADFSSRSVKEILFKNVIKCVRQTLSKSFPSRLGFIYLFISLSTQIICVNEFCSIVCSMFKQLCNYVRRIFSESDYE